MVLPTTTYNIFITLDNVLITLESVILSLRVNLQSHQEGGDINQEPPIERRGVDMLSEMINAIRKKERGVLIINIVIIDLDFSDLISSMHLSYSEVEAVILNNLDLSDETYMQVKVVASKNYQLDPESNDMLYDINTIIQMFNVSQHESSVLSTKVILIVNRAVDNLLHRNITTKLNLEIGLLYGYHVNDNVLGLDKDLLSSLSLS